MTLKNVWVSQNTKILNQYSHKNKTINWFLVHASKNQIPKEMLEENNIYNKLIFRRHKFLKHGIFSRLHPELVWRCTIPGLTKIPIKKIK